MRQVLLGLGLIVTWGLSAGAGAQSINIDLDIMFGDPALGNGAPSPAFGAAANQMGFWNRIGIIWSHPVELADLAGSPSGVFISRPTRTGGAIGFRFEGNTGAHALLLNDAGYVIDQPIEWEISGLAPGQYQFYTYAVGVQGLKGLSRVNVSGSPTGEFHVTGPMPGNAFELGITHAIHEVVVGHFPIQITISGELGDAWANGFQIIAVPEPSTVSVLAVLLVTMLARKRRARA